MATLKLTAGDTICCDMGYMVIKDGHSGGFYVDEYRYPEIESDSCMLEHDESNPQFYMSYCIAEDDLLREVRTWGVGSLQLPQDAEDDGWRHPFTRAEFWSDDEEEEEEED